MTQFVAEDQLLYSVLYGALLHVGQYIDCFFLYVLIKLSCLTTTFRR